MNTINRLASTMTPAWRFLAGTGTLLLVACSPTQRSEPGTTNPSNPALAIARKPPGNHADSPQHRELWVTHQRDSDISILKFPSGELLDGFSLPPGTQPHIVTFHGRKYAYISGMGNGTLSIVDADSRQVVKTLSFAPALCHQGKVSPDGTTMLVSVFPTRMLHKVVVDEANGSWTPVSSLEFPVGKAPVCTVFRSDGRRAYVSTMMNGVTIVDVPSMTILGTLPTDGFIACGMIKPDPHADSALIAAAGSGGHIYTLDMTNDMLVDRGTLGAASWHSLNINRQATLGFGTSPLSDEIVAFDLTTQPVTKLRTIPLQPIPGTGNNQPDAMGGGDPIVSDTLPVSLRAAGQVALIDTDSFEVDKFVEIADPSPPGAFSTMTCVGCAVHGVTVRPARHPHRERGGDDHRRD